MKNVLQKLSDKDYTLFRELILKNSGLYFDARKRDDLERRVLSAFSKSNLKSVGEYYQFLLYNPEGRGHLERLINSATVGETHFFRNAPHFVALREYILPEIIAQRRRNSRNLKIWSAGCATGEEPYSIAIVLKELIPDLESWNITIMATDINQAFLERARAGVYSDWSFRSDLNTIKRCYFSEKNHRHKIHDDIKQMVTFAYLNLAADAYPSLANNLFDVDIVFCRNVTIYFKPDFVKSVVDKLYDTLADNGWLVVGHSEPSVDTYHRFGCINFPGTVLYRKRGQGVNEGQPARNAGPNVSETRAIPGNVFVPVSAGAVLTNIDNGPVKNIGQDLPLSGFIKPESDEKLKLEKKIKAATKKADDFKTGMNLFEEGFLEQSLVKFKKYVKYHPDFVEAYYMIAKIYADQGRLDTAIEWCKRILRKNTLLPEVYYLMGLVFMQKNQYAEAKEALKKTLYLDHKFIMGYFTLANIYRIQGNGDLARRCLINAKDLLKDLPGDELIPEADGESAHKLKQTLEEALLYFMTPNNKSYE